MTASGVARVAAGLVEDPLKVLVLHSELGVLRGGGENFTRNLFAAFAERGHEVTAAFVADRAMRYPVPIPAGIRPVPLPGRWNRTLGQALFSSVAAVLPSGRAVRRGWDRLREGMRWRAIRWHDLRFQRRVERAFADRWHDFDAIYVHGNARLASQVARHRRTVLRLPGPVGPELAPLLRDVHAVCANGDALLRVRSFLHDDALELPAGVDQERFRPGRSTVRQKLGWAAGDVVFGYVGRLTHLKGIDLLATAFHQMAGSATSGKLLVIGTGEDEAEVRTQLEAEIGRGLVHLEASVDHDHLPDWYRAMDVFVMPSRYENFSNAILEATACGVPFIASDVGGNQILGQTGAGWLFECGSADALEECMRNAVVNRAEVTTRAGIARCETRLQSTWAVAAERLERIIRERRGEAS